MTISLPVGVMTADEKPESSHEYNFFLDRQLQNKLLEFDEQDIDSRYFQNVKLEGKAYRAQVRSEEVTGWVFDTKTNFRKPEKESNKQQKEFIQPWKDYKAKQQKDDSFMFRHYGDLKKYIQQYREEHSNVFGFRPPGVPMKSDAPIGEIRKYLNHHSAPTPSAGATHHNQTSAHNHISSQTQVSTVCTQCTNSNGNQQLITASMYYTNRKDSSVSLPNGASVSNSRNNHNSHSHGHHCSKHNSHINPDHAYKYKLAPEAAWRSDSVQSSCVDSDRNDGVRTPRINSAKGDRGKSPTKVMVPAGASNGPPKGHPLQSVTVQAKQSGDHAQTSGSSRTLDTLACVAAEKQIEPEFPPDSAGLTWCERLELLRAVNKRPEKVKPKPPRIRFFKDPPKESPDASSPLVAQSTRAHLYEQRRMKHLLEQAKVKGTDQFEWLTDSVRFRGVTSDVSDSSDDDSDECSAGGSAGSRCTSTKPYGPGMDVNNAESALLQRYNMPSVKGGGWKMTPYPVMIRSRTTLFQS